MAKTPDYSRRVWDDRFNEPDVEQLREDLPKDASRLFDHLRERLLALAGVRESVVWCGPCWRWVIEYRTPGGSGSPAGGGSTGSKAEDDPLAMVIPSPEDLQLVVPLDQQVMENLPVGQMKRAVKDGLELAKEPYDTRWAVWSVQYANVLDELVQLVELKYEEVTR